MRLRTRCSGPYAHAERTSGHLVCVQAIFQWACFPRSSASHSPLRPKVLTRSTSTLRNPSALNIFQRPTRLERLAAGFFNSSGIPFAHKKASDLLPSPSSNPHQAQQTTETHPPPSRRSGTAQAYIAMEKVSTITNVCAHRFALSAEGTSQLHCVLVHALQELSCL